MRRLTWWLVAVPAVAVMTPAIAASGQSVGDVAAYAALVSTPTAGVAPTTRQWMLDEPRGGVAVDVRWGHVSAAGGNVDDVIGGVALPFADGRADVALALGYAMCGAIDCKGNFVADAAIEGRVLEERTESSMFALGLDWQFGYGSPRGGSVLSSSIGVPLSLAVGKAGHAQVVPFITPAFGWGQLSGGGSKSGTRMILGGGVGVMNLTPGLGLTAGAQKVFINGGKTVFGLGLTWSAPTPAR